MSGCIEDMWIDNKLYEKRLNDTVSVAEATAQFEKERRDLRDKFAMAALDAVIAGSGWVNSTDREIARSIYEIADAIMEVRSE